jgi:hypothetical protein
VHFHLPKPLHGWREFAGEVGIIVIGVLLALGAQQVVEWMHWRSEVMDAQRALDREAAYDLGAVEKRQQEVPCIDRRLREIRTLLSGDASGLRSGSRAPLGQPQLWRPRTDVWQVAVAGQAAEQMPLATRLGYAGLYGAFQWYAQKAEDETDAWSVLAELDDPGVLSPEDIASILQARSRAHVAADKMEANLPRIIAAGARLGIKPAAVEETSLTANSLNRLCAPLSSAG